MPSLRVPLPARRLVASVLLLALSACERPAPRSTAVAHNGPVVLITLSDLRADLVGSLGGEPGWTPELDRFAEEAGWATRAIASSSSPVPSMVSLSTGVDPWQHGVLSHLFAHRRRDLPTLAEMMTSEGYSTRVFARKAGDAQNSAFDGFQSSRRLGDGELAASALREIGDRPELIWIHLPEVGLPFKDRRTELPSLADRPSPDRVLLGKSELLSYADPAVELSSSEAETARELYRQEVAWADFQVGRYLQAIRDSGNMQGALVIITALHGTELGEQGQMLFAQNLSRESIEVPLIVHWPEGVAPAEVDRGPIAVARVWATIAETIGHAPLPVHLPSLYRKTRLPVLSSLYLHDAKNRFAVIVRSDTGELLQATVTVPFAPAEPHFFAAQAAESAQGRKVAQRIRRRLLNRFKATPPLSGWSPPRSTPSSAGPDERRTVQVSIRRWLEGSGTERVEDPSRQDRLKQLLEERWRRFVDRERTPMEQVRQWAK